MERRPKRWPLPQSHQESFYVKDAGCLSSLSSLFSTTSDGEPDPEAYLEPHPGTLYHPPRRRPFLFPCRYQGGVYAFLKARKEQRLRELRNCWHAVSLRLAAWQPALEGYYDAEEDTAEKWVAFLRASPAFEALARFFSLCKALLSPHRSPPELLAASPNGVDPTPLLASSDKPSGHQGHDHESDQDQDEPVTITTPTTQEAINPERWC